MKNLFSPALLVSPNGTNWSSITNIAFTFTNMAANALTAGNGSFLAVGGAGTIWQSGLALQPGFRTPALRWLPGTGMRLMVEVEPLGATVTFEASADFRHWSPLATMTNVSGVVEFVDTEAPRHGQRFYRAKRR